MKSLNVFDIFSFFCYYIKFVIKLLYISESRQLFPKLVCNNWLKSVTVIFMSIFRSQQWNRIFFGQSLDMHWHTQRKSQFCEVLEKMLLLDTLRTISIRIREHFVHCLRSRNSDILMYIGHRIKRTGFLYSQNVSKEISQIFCSFLILLLKIHYIKNILNPFKMLYIQKYVCTKN